MSFNFDQLVDRCHTDSAKWCEYDPDVLPMWVADMDFESPPAVVQALRERIEHRVFGYCTEPEELRRVVIERLERMYDWQVEPEEILFSPAIVSSFNLVCHTLASPGEGVLLQTPVYPPMLSAPGHAGLTNDEMELTRRSDGTYEIDFDLFERTITDQTRVFILCNPHNPVGRVFRRDELERMAEICLQRNVIICSDEIHCDLLLDGNRHIPIASLAAEISAQTVTLMAPSKTFNIPGLKSSLTIVQNAELRERLEEARKGLIPSVNLLGYTAALAAYRDGQPWLNELLTYLEGNLEYLTQYVETELPGVSMARPEGTYLAWLDCREAGIAGPPHEFFLERARVAVNDGESFGQGGEGFVRFNFGCPRSMLVEALDRMSEALLNSI